MDGSDVMNRVDFRMEIGKVCNCSYMVRGGGCGWWLGGGGWWVVVVGGCVNQL